MNSATQTAAPHSQKPIRFILTLLLILCSHTALSDEIIMSAGGGSQPGSDQTNRLASVDFSFYSWERSPRQHLHVGVSYTQLGTGQGPNRKLYAVSVYPQLTLYPQAGGKIATRSPQWAEPYFFVKALGPSYISENSLGSRVQDRHFSFLAQIGVGFLVKIDDKMKANFSISWRHLSNANLFRDNDGIDAPLVIGWGIKF